MARVITVLAADNQDALHVDGAQVEETRDTLKDAKARARYFLSEEYRLRSEVSQRLGYAEVRVNGKVVADFTN